MGLENLYYIALNPLGIAWDSYFSCFAIFTSDNCTFLESQGCGWQHDRAEKETADGSTWRKHRDFHGTNGTQQHVDES